VKGRRSPGGAGVQRPLVSQGSVGSFPTREPPASDARTSDSAGSSEAQPSRVPSRRRSEVRGRSREAPPHPYLCAGRWSGPLRCPGRCPEGYGQPTKLLDVPPARLVVRPQRCATIAARGRAARAQHECHDGQPDCRDHDQKRHHLRHAKKAVRGGMHTSEGPLVASISSPVKRVAARTRCGGQLVTADSFRYQVAIQRAVRVRASRSQLERYVTMSTMSRAPGPRS
jgi:hypothetical protein